MKTEYAYDPDFPYVVVWGEYGAARFESSINAASYATQSVGNVIDTTPKPKIPEGADFITWVDEAGQEIAFRENFNPRKPWSFYGDYYSSEALIELIGDAEVTVLVPRETS